MDSRRRQASYIAMWVFAITFGWMEAATVVYLRATSPAVANSAVGTQFPAVLVSNRLVAVEIIREACTILDPRCRGLAGFETLDRPTRRVSFDLRRVGSHILRRAPADFRVAVCGDQSRHSFPDSGALDWTRVGAHDRRRDLRRRRILILYLDRAAVAPLHDR